MHDPRLGRFFAVDPLSRRYAYNSPYAFSENRVIDGVELEGLEWSSYFGTLFKTDVIQKVKGVGDVIEDGYDYLVETMGDAADATTDAVVKAEKYVSQWSGKDSNQPGGTHYYKKDVGGKQGKDHDKNSTATEKTQFDTSDEIEALYGKMSSTPGANTPTTTINPKNMANGFKKGYGLNKEVKAEVKKRDMEATLNAEEESTSNLDTISVTTVLDVDSNGNSEITSYEYEVVENGDTNTVIQKVP